jgi:phospholipid transport system substrate-binding protein
MFTAKQFLLLTFLQISLLTVQGQSKAATEVVTPVKKMITQIRASQDAQALNQMEMVSISKYLLGAYYDKATDQQRNEFTGLFQSLFARIAFPRVLGSSLLESIRDDQVQPVLKEGGMEHLLQVMRDKKREK